MPKFEDLEIKEAAHEAAPTDVGAMPEERGGSKPNLPQRHYTFVLPANLAEVLDKTESKEYGDRLKLDLSGEGLPAYVPGPPQDGKPTWDYAGQWFGRITALPRNKSKRGEPERLVADLTYLAVALGHPSKPIKHANGKVEFVSFDTQRELYAALVSHAGQQFQADNEWSANCNDQNVRYISDGAGGSTQDPAGTKGCGARFYSRDIPKDGQGAPQERFPCPKCGAALLAFQNLGRFGAVAG